MEPAKEKNAKYVHANFHDTTVDENTDTTHAVLFNNMYHGPAKKVSEVGKNAPREKLSMANVKEPDESEVPVKEKGATSMEGPMSHYTLTHDKAKEPTSLGKSGETKSA